MSTFIVQLNNINQGQLDYNPATATAILVGNDPQATESGSLVGLGQQMSPSIQRTMFVAGPNRIYRELYDGMTFTDCNYWKQFAYPQVPLDQAFITIAPGGDDGSVYSNVPGENVFSVTPTNSGGSNVQWKVLSTDTFSTNSLDIVATYGGYATFLQIQNFGTIVGGNSTGLLKYQLNGNANMFLTLKAGVTVIYNTGDLTIGKLAFQGDGTNAQYLEILLSIQSACSS